jgi:hypothetical protein
MPTDANARAHAVGDGAAAGVVQLRSNFAQARTGAYGCVPRLLVHAEPVEIDHVNSDLAVRAAEACYHMSAKLRRG